MTAIWRIVQLDCVPTTAIGEDYVIRAYWQCEVEDDGIADRSNGSTTFAVQSGEAFVPFAELTEAQVLEWCFANGVQKDDVELHVATKVALQKNPPVVTPSLPWTTA